MHSLLDVFNWFTVRRGRGGTGVGIVIQTTEENVVFQ